MNIQDKIQEIHQKYGVTEMANYKIQLFVDDLIKTEKEQLRLHIVSQQRELLLDFLSKVNGNLITHPHLQMNTDFVEDYLKSNVLRI